MKPYKSKEGRIRSSGFSSVVFVLLTLLVSFAFDLMAAEETPAPDLAALFRYDANVPFSVKESGSEKRGDVTVHDITFSGTVAPVKAFLVQPAGKGPFAAILYVHWLGEPETTNRTEFLDEAVRLASRGAVSLLIDSMWAQAGWYEKRVPEEDFDNSIRQVIDLRRAMDFLVSQPGVDPRRIGFVGHDFGAMYGAVMGAVDPRPLTYVLIAGTPVFSDWYLFAAQPRDLPGFKKQMSAIDPGALVTAIKDASIFFQFADSDRYVSEQDAQNFYKAANPRKHMATYHADHGMAGENIRADRNRWLTAELGLKQ